MTAAVHKPMRQGDELVCSQCHVRWDVNETAPEGCVLPASATNKSKRRKKKEDGLAYWKRARGL